MADDIERRAAEIWVDAKWGPKPPLVGHERQGANVGDYRAGLIQMTLLFGRTLGVVESCCDCVSYESCGLSEEIDRVFEGYCTHEGRE